MIISFFIVIFYSLLSLLFSVFPVISLPSSITDSLYIMISYIQAYSFIFPITTLLTVLLLSTTFHLGILSFRILHWIIGKVRGSH